MKRSFGPKTLIFPAPVWCVGSYGVNGEPHVKGIDQRFKLLYRTDSTGNSVGNKNGCCGREERVSNEPRADVPQN